MNSYKKVSFWAAKLSAAAVSVSLSFSFLHKEQSLLHFRITLNCSREMKPWFRCALTRMSIALCTCAYGTLLVRSLPPLHFYHARDLIMVTAIDHKRRAYGPLECYIHGRRKTGFESQWSHWSNTEDKAWSRKGNTARPQIHEIVLGFSRPVLSHSGNGYWPQKTRRLKALET